MRISTEARKAAEFCHGEAQNAITAALIGEVKTLNFESHIQLAINSACRPLVEALEKVSHDMAARLPQPLDDLLRETITAHQKEHGP